MGTVTVGGVLAHHGILGMKWGVRKDKPSFSDPEAERKRIEGQKRLKKALIIGGAVLVTAAVATTAYFVGRHYIKNLTPVTLDVATKLQNVNNVGNDLNLDRPIFAAFKDSDKKIYAGEKFVGELLGRPGNKVAYKTVLENTQPIKAPSVSQTKKLFEAWKSEQGIVNKGLTLNNWNRGMMAVHPTPNPNSFISFMQKKGYNAIIDTLDQSSSYYKAKTPLLIFQGSNTLTTIGSEFLKSSGLI